VKKYDPNYHYKSQNQEMRVHNNYTANSSCIAVTKLKEHQKSHKIYQAHVPQLKT
jgi:hypothetical protein